MKYFHAVLAYCGPRGHWNQARRVFSAPEEMTVNPELIQFHLTRKELVLGCCLCPPGTFLRPKSKEEAKVAVRVHGLTPVQFEELGLPAECLADSKQ